MRFLTYSNSLHKYKIKRSVNKLKLFEIIFIILFVLFFSGMLYENISENKIKTGYKEKGKLATINKTKVAYNIMNHGKLTVILESDAGAGSKEWTKVIKSIPKDIRVFYYDRPGYGNSETADKELNIKTEAQNLHDLLEKSGVKGPYILVGSSYGGLINTSFAASYPDSVAGVILIDSLTEDQICNDNFKKSLKKEKRTRSIEKNLSTIGITRLLENSKILSIREDIRDNLSGETAKVFKSESVSKKYLKAYSEELGALLNYKDFSQKEGLLEDKPLIVMSSENKGLDEKSEKERLDYQQGLLKLSSKSESLIVNKDIKNIPLEDPETVVSAIKNVIKKVGKIN